MNPTKMIILKLKKLHIWKDRQKILKSILKCKVNNFGFLTNFNYIIKEYDHSTIYTFFYQQTIT